MEEGGYEDSWLAKYRFHCTDFRSSTYHLKKKSVQSDCFITKIKCKIKNENRSYAVANSFVVQSFNFTNFTKHSLGYADNCKKGMFYFLQKLCSSINSFVLNNRPPTLVRRGSMLGFLWHGTDQFRSIPNYFLLMQLYKAFIFLGSSASLITSVTLRHPCS